MPIHSQVAQGAKFEACEIQHQVSLPRSIPAVESKAKRSFDLLTAATVLVLLIPLLLLVACLIRAHDGGPAFYRHQRLGRNQSRFACLKFRTMRTDSREALEKYLNSNPAAKIEWSQTHKLKDDPRITPIGRVLRKTSLDELPQLINILRGEMSIVGPRPIVGDEVEKYGPDAVAYFSVRPGLTGAWQVSGRSETSYEERVRLDRLYVETWSLMGDIAIILRTIPAVFFAKGSY